MGPGLLAKYDLFLDHPKWGNLTFRYSHWTIFVVAGPTGKEAVNLFDVRYSFPVFRQVNFGVEYSYYLRMANYTDEEPIYEVTDKIYEFRAFAAYQF